MYCGNNVPLLNKNTYKRLMSNLFTAFAYDVSNNKGWRYTIVWLTLQVKFSFCN